MLAAVLFINYVDRGTLPTAMPLLRGDLHLNDTQTGILLSAFFWTYTPMQMPVGWLAERFGAHRVLAISLALWASATMLVGFAHTFIALLLLRLLLGLGESAGFPSASKLLAAAVPPAGLGLANGIVAFAYLFGPAVGLFAGGILMAQFGWRSAFFVFGALSLLWLWPWVGVARQVPVRAHSNTAEDAPKFLTVFKNPAMWGTGLGLFSTNYTFYFMLTWLPSYLVRARGFSMVEMAQVGGLSYAVNALSALAGGWAIDRYIRRGGSGSVAYKAVLAVAQIGYVVCMLSMAVGSKPVALSAMFLFQVLSGVSSPCVFAVSQILAGPHAAGRWVGIQNTCGSLAGIVAPWLTGFIIDRTHSFTNAFLVGAAVSVLGLIGWVWMLPALAELPWKKLGSRAAAAALT
ncbi:MAG: MFS transporter [Steroidobacteraceae bacterium]